MENSGFGTGSGSGSSSDSEECMIGGEPVSGFNSVTPRCLLDCKVPSLTKLDRVDVLPLLQHGMHLLNYLCF